MQSEPQRRRKTIFSWNEAMRNCSHGEKKEMNKEKLIKVCTVQSDHTNQVRVQNVQQDEDQVLDATVNICLCHLHLVTSSHLFSMAYLSLFNSNIDNSFPYTMYIITDSTCKSLFIIFHSIFRHFQMFHLNFPLIIMTKQAFFKNFSLCSTIVFCVL